MEEFEKHRNRIFTAIDSGSLLVICGAGLSMSAPSNLPSATEVARECYRKYSATDNIDPKIENDISKISEHYYKLGNDSFETFLLHKVPWNMFSGKPNDGHATLADLLLCNALEAVLSANFDTMIERWVNNFSDIDFQAALSGVAATQLAKKGKPLIKIHGCMNSDSERKNTLWTDCQLSDEVIAKRIESIKDWLKLNLPNVHLIIVGFWTDWSYLNEAIEHSLEDMKLKSVIVVDPASSENLKDKAVKLWEILNSVVHRDEFFHIQCKGGEFLDFLRIEFSKNWMRRFYKLNSDIEDISHMVDKMEAKQLYEFRKDIEGIDYRGVSRWKEPQESAVSTLKSHIELINKGAEVNGTIFQIKGKKIRVVNPNGRSINQLVEKFDQPSLLVDIMLCAGAPDEEIREDLMYGDSSVKWWSASRTYEELERITDYD